MSRFIFTAFIILFFMMVLYLPIKFLYCEVQANKQINYKVEQYLPNGSTKEYYTDNVRTMRDGVMVWSKDGYITIHGNYTLTPYKVGEKK